MVLKAIKNSLKQNCQKKKLSKKNSMKKKNKQIWTKFFFWKFSKVPKFGYFPLHPMQRLAQHNNNCDVTVAMIPNGLQLRLHCPIR